MPNLATTKMSSKGQVVIPELIRKQLGLKAGMKGSDITTAVAKAKRTQIPCRFHVQSDKRGKKGTGHKL